MKDSDLIRRSDALKELWYPFDFTRTEIDININHIPAVDAVEVKHGEWIPFKGETGVEAFGYKEYTSLGFGCSVCHADIDVSEEYFRYCPWCGARMDGRREDGDT